MSFDFDATILPIRPDIQSVLRRKWRRLARPGTWWTGAQRIALAAQFRRAQAGEPPEPSQILPDPASEAVRLLAVKPWTAKHAWVEGLVTAGLDYPAYVELVGVVSRMSSVDGFHRALGIGLEPLPEAEPGEPSRQPPPDEALLGRARVPMVGGAGIVMALSAVPQEMAAQEDLHRLYLTYEQMGVATFQRGLHRTQMELVAGRTSALNGCFY